MAEKDPCVIEKNGEAVPAAQAKRSQGEMPVRIQDAAADEKENRRKRRQERDSMEQRNIIHASEEDAGELLALYKAQLGRPFCFWDEDYPGRETIEYDLSRNALFVLKENGRILASISIDQDENVERLDCWHKELAPGGELSRLAVLPEMQNRGLARIMLGFGMEELKRRGCRSVHFLVSKGNIKAIRSYAVFGIKVVGERYLYGQDYLCYEKDLQDQVSK